MTLEVTPSPFTVNRIGVTDVETTVEYSVSGGGTDFDSAEADDFVGNAFPSGLLTFPAGDTSARTLSIDVAADNAPESDEGFTVSLSNASGNAVISTESAEGVIRDDDGNDNAIAFSITADDIELSEGNDGEETRFRFTVTRAGNTDVPAAVDYLVMGTGDDMADAQDFVGDTLPTDRLMFPMNVESRTVDVVVSGDSTLEPDEGFLVKLMNPSADAEITTPMVTATIRNDDTGFDVSIDIIEGESPLHNAAMPADVTNDGVVTAMDVLVIVNRLRREGAEGESTSNRVVYTDVNGDNQLTPGDAIRVVNYLNRMHVDQMTAESESPVTGSSLAGETHSAARRLSDAGPVDSLALRPPSEPHESLTFPLTTSGTSAGQEQDQDDDEEDDILSLLAEDVVTSRLRR